MSLLIKGMDMPECCEVCPCYNWVEDICRITESPNEFSDARIRDCPLVEVPASHGRLIDAEALIQMLKERNCADCGNSDGTECDNCWVDDCFLHIDNSPTIIEAEE